MAVDRPEPFEGARCLDEAAADMTGLISFGVSSLAEPE
jgi:hypothetical protein